MPASSPPWRSPRVLLTAAGCSVKTCAGQCGPPFQLQVVFRDGTSKPAAAAAMRNCQADPLVIRIGQPYRSHAPGTPGQWTAIIYTKKMPIGAADGWRVVSSFPVASMWSISTSQIMILLERETPAS